jgi:murein DD-endopeptidase MepM/ murein hydrolase activator NlpD
VASWAAEPLAARAPQPGASAPAATAVVVRPGTLVRWPGEGIEWCQAGAERSEPLDGACLFPVDLLQRAGPLELTRQRQGALERASVRVSRFDYPVQRLTLPKRMVELSPEDAERVRRENRELAPLWKSRGSRRFALPLAPPLDPLPKGGRFGHRRVINGQPRSPHGGADFDAPEGAPVRAVGDGTVALVADHFFSGRAVFLDHGDGLVSQYFHLSRVDVAQGQELRRGERIGAVGSTGRATGPHLHFGTRFRGARVDPLLLLGPLSAVPCLDPPRGLGCR